MLTWAAIIPVMHAVAFVVVLFFGTRMPCRGSEATIASMGLGVGLSLWAAAAWIAGPRTAVQTQLEWFSYGDTKISGGTLVDGATVMMLVVVSVISLVVQVYSATYMRQDRRYTHFFAILTLFTAAMEWFVMSASTLQMIFGWEVMALCSFLLIGHWWEEKHNVNAALKAFLTTRASDIGLFVGVAVLFFAAGETFDVTKLNDAAGSDGISHGLLVAGAVALFIAVIGKSAQFPLHTWLPDAMAGPTPMSALIHAATMVVAGVFLLVRIFPVFDQAFEITPAVAGGGFANPIAIIGAITILIAALLAFVQRDIKKVLSYSTVSQLGFMVMAIGVGGVKAAMFHLFTHAFFKALLFLAAGNISHAVHGFDLAADMGGLRKHLPITHATFAVGAMCLVGIIPFSGFWSKEQIVSTAGANGYGVFMLVAVLGSLLTAAYMMRCYYLAFAGERRGTTRVHEVPLSMSVPCIVLAVLSVLSGFVSLPVMGFDPFRTWFFPAQPTDEHVAALPLALEAVLPLLGLGLAGFAFRRRIGPRVLAERSALARAVYNVLSNHYYLDWLYERVFVRGIRRGLSWLVHWVDHNVIDNAVDAFGRLIVLLGRVVVRRIDTGFIDIMVNDSGTIANGAGDVLARVQSGRVQRYVAIMISVVTLVALGVSIWR